MPKKILIVEDEANIRELLRLYLEREGYTVLEAENGVEGISMHYFSTDKIRIS